MPKAILTRIKTRIMCCMAYYTYKNKKAFMTENNKILHEIIKKNMCKMAISTFQQYNVSPIFTKSTRPYCHVQKDIYSCRNDY